MRLTSLLIVLGLGLAACSTKHKGTYEKVASATPGAASDALMAEAESLWEQRSDKTQLQAALVKYEAVMAADPDNRVAAGRLVRGWYFLGDTFEAEKDGKLAAWDTSISWGKRCLAINDEFTALLEKGDEDEASASRAFGADDVPCLYWTSSALGKWAKLSGLGKTLKNLPTVKAYMTRAGELDPTYFYTGPDRYWGAYYCAIPSFAGRDLDKGRSHIDKAIAASPEYLGTKVILADYWARSAQEKAIFIQTLNEVIAADPNVDPAIAPENRAAQQTAKDLLAMTDEYFAD